MGYNISKNFASFPDKSLIFEVQPKPKPMIKRHSTWYWIMILLLIAASCSPEGGSKESGPDEFSFVFMTDIHLMPFREADSGFLRAIEKVNELNPDFVVTGGDLIMDALSTTYEEADSQYRMYTRISDHFEMPVYNTIGNHEVYGWYEESGADTLHPEYGKKMFGTRVGPRYHSETIRGWKFFFLDSVVKNGKGGYEGGIDEEQIAWIKQELQSTDTAMPLVISTHIPFMTLEAQLFRGSSEANHRGAVVNNSKEILELFTRHDLKLVLQGHVHYYEMMESLGRSFVTGGAVSGAWWSGTVHGTEEGFLLVRVKGREMEWEYIDYGWTPSEDQEIRRISQERGGAGKGRHPYKGPLKSFS